MKYFTYSELTSSVTAKNKGIDNTPTQEVKDNLKQLVDNVLDPLREHIGEPIIVSSGYRCPKLNAAVGGSKTSQHMTGQAADIHLLSRSKAKTKELFTTIIKLGLPFDQLIDEYNYSWIHVSFSPRNRRQVLHLKK